MGMDNLVLRNAREEDMVSEMLTNEAPTITPKYKNPLPLSISKKSSISDIYGVVAGEESVVVADGPEFYINSENLPGIEEVEAGTEFEMKIRVVVTRFEHSEDIMSGCKDNYSLKINKVTIGKETINALALSEELS